MAHAAGFNVPEADSIDGEVADNLVGIMHVGAAPKGEGRGERQQTEVELEGKG